MEHYEYDIALSFAEEDNWLASNIYLALKLSAENNTIFYYKKNLDNIGTQLKKRLPEIYKHKARFVIMLVSKNYINKDKTYAAIEAEAILERWKFNPNASFLIPVRMDDTLLQKVDTSLSDGVHYLKWNKDPETLAAEIWRHVRGDNDSEEKSEDKPVDPTGSSGTVFTSIGDVTRSVQVGSNHGNIDFKS